MLHCKSPALSVLDLTLEYVKTMSFQYLVNPVLHYDRIYTREEMSGGKGIESEKRYFVKVSREGGEGEAKGVTATPKAVTIF
jgi:hypothetical protein